MSPFSTEFPIKPSAHSSAFIAEVIAWLRGIPNSTLLDAAIERDLAHENAHLRSETGEELRLRELRRGDAWDAVGFRHDVPDTEGRLWRTEGVIRRRAAENDQDLIRLRTQCVAKTAWARLENARKPYLVKALLNSGWGGADGSLIVSDQPKWLTNDREGLALARSLTLGEGTNWLPCVYFSATGKGTWSLSQRQIEKIAYDLGGVAHVVVEPERAFSFQLRDETDSQNAYGGSVGLLLPKEGSVRRFYVGWQIQDASELATVIREAALGLRGRMPSLGWDWTELQEEALRAQREREKNRLSVRESEQLYQEEISNLRDRIQQLENERLSRPLSHDVGTVDAEFIADNLVRRIGPEIYEGEISDRLRLAARATLSSANQIGLDERSKVVLERVIQRLPVSPALAELREDLMRATKDPKRIANELTALLLRHGYREKGDNKHIRLEASDDFQGLGGITIAKTPSDHRSAENMRKQIERTLGINKITK